MKSLTPQLRNRAAQHLTRQLMRKAPRDVATSRGAGQDSGALRLIKSRDQRVAVDVGDFFEEVRLEMTTDRRRGSQNALCLCRHALHPALEHDAHGVGQLDILEVELAHPLLTRVEQASFFLQMAKQLGNEERIATGVIGERSCESGRRVGLAERRQQALHVGLRKRAQHDRVSEPLADELIERRLDRPEA